VCFAIAITCIVCAVFLFTFCIPSVVGRESVCLFPHWLAATLFALVGAIFAALGIFYGAIARLSLEPAWHELWRRRWRSVQPDSDELVRP
jgi:hypothetical protein